MHGLSDQRWRQLLDDSAWLLDKFTLQAFRDGWTIGELFGLWWYDDAGLQLKDGWGGIADRLQGSRSLVMTADRARWRCMVSAVPQQFNRTAYPNLKAFWELTDE